MTLPAHTFSGASFFSSVRSAMDANRGLFAGSDGGLQFVILDAALYRPEIFRRPNTQSFTDAASSLGSDVRVVVNGQIFGRSKTDYCFLGPCAVQWQGEIIEAGTVLTGNPATLPNHRFFGRENAIPIWRNHVAQGDPSSFGGPKLHYALGALIPLIEKKIRFGSGNIGAPPTVTQLHSTGAAQWISFPRGVGKTVLGIHRASGCLFALCQEHDAAPGIGVGPLISLLMTMGVDDAVLCDGSDSATLLVDGIVHAQPASYKNNSIPNGVLFRLKEIPFQPNGTLEVITGSTDTLFLNEFTIGSILLGISGIIRARTAGGLELELSSFGTGGSLSSGDIANLMGFGGSLPITLTAGSTDLTAGVTFAQSGGVGVPAVSFALRVSHTPGQFDRLAGMLTVQNSRGSVLAAATIPI